MFTRRIPLLLIFATISLISCQLINNLNTPPEDRSTTPLNTEVDLIQEPMEGKQVKARIETVPTPTVEPFTIDPELPDLSLSLVCPAGMVPGEFFSESLIVTVTNQGQLASDFAVDLVLSTDTNIPIVPAVPQETFVEDMLVGGGRQVLSRLSAGVSHTLPRFSSELALPSDIPEGSYYLAAVADSGNRVMESDEANNVALCPFQVCPALAEITSVTLETFSGFPNGPAEISLNWSWGEGQMPQGAQIRVIRWQDGAWKNVLSSQESIPVAAVEAAGQADVSVLGAQSGQYRVVFEAEYSCGAQRKYAFELRIP